MAAPLFGLATARISLTAQKAHFMYFTQAIPRIDAAGTAGAEKSPFRIKTMLNTFDYE